MRKKLGKQKWNGADKKWGKIGLSAPISKKILIPILDNIQRKYPKEDDNSWPFEIRKIANACDSTFIKHDRQNEER